MKGVTKIVLASGIFYPAVGGPAIHVRHIAEKLVAEGWDVVVLTYSNTKERDTFPFTVERISESYPKLLRWIIYSWKVFIATLNADAVYAFDVSAAGIPAFCAAKLFRKKFIVRIGGDPIWERVVEKNKRFMPLSEYYKEKLHQKDKPALFSVIKWMLLRSDRVVTYTDILINLYTEYYDVPKEKFLKIKNPFLSDNKNSIENIPDEPTFLFAGRFVSYKNLEMVIDVFSSLRRKHNKGILKLFGSGPEEKKIREQINKLKMEEHVQIYPNVSQNELFSEIQSASVCLAPALTEFNPNFILECLSFRKPALITKGNGLSISLPDEFLFSATDPEDLKNKMNSFFDDSFYTRALSVVSGFELRHTWDDVTEAHYKFLSLLISSN